MKIWRKSFCFHFAHLVLQILQIHQTLEILQSLKILRIHRHWLCNRSFFHLSFFLPFVLPFHPYSFHSFLPYLPYLPCLQRTFWGFSWDRHCLRPYFLTFWRWHHWAFYLWNLPCLPCRPYRHSCLLSHAYRSHVNPFPQYHISFFSPYPTTHHKLPQYL